MWSVLSPLDRKPKPAAVYIINHKKSGRVRNLSAVVLKSIARYKLVRSFKMEKSYFEAKISFNAFPLYLVR